MVTVGLLVAAAGAGLDAGAPAAVLENLQLSGLDQALDPPMVEVVIGDLAFLARAQVEDLAGGDVNS